MDRKSEHDSQLTNSPIYVIALSIPLSCKLRLRSHSALGRIIDIVVVSNTLLVQQGRTISNTMILNFPYPVCSIASSKSAPSAPDFEAFSAAVNDLIHWNSHIMKNLWHFVTLWHSLAACSVSTTTTTSKWYFCTIILMRLRYEKLNGSTEYIF